MDPAPPATCPRCRKVPLDDQPLIRHCARCKGSWIAEETLHARISEARGARTGPGLPWHLEGRAALMCAVCAEPMETLVVADTAIDRCPRHGVWFDAKELARVLAVAAAVAPAAAAAASQQVAAQQAAAQQAAAQTESIVPDVIETGAELAVDAAYVAHAALDHGHASAAADVAGAADVAEAASDLGDGAADVAEAAASGAAEAVGAGGGIFDVLLDGVGAVAEAVVDAVAGIFSSLD